MQKFKKAYIKTGDFAKLCGTNKRTLIHYDEIGLFRPAYTDEKGYRYYSENQFDVFFTIVCLKELGMPLKEIGAFLDQRNPQALKELLLEQQEKIKKEEERLRKIKEVVDTKLSLLSLQESLKLRQAKAPEDGLFFRSEAMTGHIFLEQTPEEYLLLSEPIHSNDHKTIIQALCRHIGYCNHHSLNAGHPYGAMLDVADLRENRLDTYAYFITKVNHRPEGHPFHVKPAGTYAVAYLLGDYYDSEATYAKLFAWIDQNHFQTGQYSYKEAVIDELASASSSEYLTKISIQVFDRQSPMVDNT